LGTALVGGPRFPLFLVLGEPRFPLFLQFETLNVRIIDPTPRFLDAFAAELALSYAAGRVNFAFSDSAVNDLWAVLISRFEQVDEGEWPKLFSEVFEAFDAGEFRRPGDADPVALYTDPAIAEIIAKLG